MLLPTIFAFGFFQAAQPAVPSPPVTPYSVGGAVRAPRLIRRIKVTEPKRCSTSRFRLDDGAFMFRATVAENGDVTEVKTLKAPRLKPACPDLEQAYRRAIVQWKYEPAKLHGRPVSVYLKITSLLEPR